MPASKIQNETEVVRWFAEGRTYAWMCEEYERRYNISTTVSMWGNFRRTRGLARRIVRDDELIPWLLAEEHRWSYDARMLRVEGRRRAGAPLPQADAARLERWRTRLEDSGCVVEYDPATGFRHVPRRPGVDHDLIRVPDVSTTRQRAVDQYEPPAT